MTQENNHQNTHNDSTSDAKLNAESSHDNIANTQASDQVKEHQNNSNSQHDRVTNEAENSTLSQSTDDPAQAIQHSTVKENAFKKRTVIAIGLIILIILIGLIAFGLWKSYQPKTVDVQGREAEEREKKSAGKSQRDGACKDHEGIAKALELCSEDEEDQDP